MKRDSEATQTFLALPTSTTLLNWSLLRLEEGDAWSAFFSSVIKALPSFLETHMVIHVHTHVHTHIQAYAIMYAASLHTHRSEYTYTFTA